MNLKITIAHKNWTFDSITFDIGDELKKKMQKKKKKITTAKSIYMEMHTIR